MDSEKLMQDLIVALQAVARKSRDSSISPKIPSPYKVSPTDTTDVILASPPLSLLNYAQWACNVQRSLRVRSKQGFLTGELKEPASSDELHKYWVKCNDLVVGWLLRCIDPSIASTVASLDKASEIWGNLEERFTHPDEDRVGYLQHEIGILVQGDLTVDTFFTKLTTLWQELEALRPPSECKCGKCNDDCFKPQREQRAKDLVHKFLRGLNVEFRPLRSQLVSQKPFPTLNEAYQAVFQEEQRLLVPILATPEASALITRVSTAPRRTQKQCIHCGKAGHIVDECYKLVGYPKGQNKKGKGPRSRPESENASAHNVTVQTTPDAGEEAAQITQQQLQTLLKALATQSGAATSQQLLEQPSGFAGLSHSDGDWES